MMRLSTRCKLSDKSVVESVNEPTADNSVLEQIAEHNIQPQKIKATSESQALCAKHRDIGKWLERWSEYIEADHELPNHKQLWQERCATNCDVNQFYAMLQALTYVSSIMMDDDKK